MVLVEEAIFAYAVYVVPFDIYRGWWEHVNAEDAAHNIPVLVKVSVFFLLLFMCQLCFVRVSITNPGFILEETKTVQQAEDSMTFIEKKRNGKVRTCSKCKATKPDRAHHCSICNKCVLKMDHHCPFVNNCIGFFNYKYFLNLLFWVMSFCIYVIVIVVLDGIQRNQIRYTATVAGVMCAVALFLVSVLFFNHVRFVTHNETTIEHVEKRKTIAINQYDLGIRRNLAQVFGTNPFLWLFPFWTSRGSGHSYEVHPNASESSFLLTGSS